MYGLLLEGIYYYLRTIFGDETLNEVRQKANISHTNFSTHKVYSETVIPRLARAAQEVTGMPQEELMESFGVTFVSYVSRYGYDRILKVLGRNVRDFLSNLDNLHEYLRFSYPKIKPPSFFVTDETIDGITLHYRSKRRGFKNYLKGQVRQVGKEFYGTDIKVVELVVDDSHGTSYAQMRLTFDNTESFVRIQKKFSSKDIELPITSQQFFNLFPFHLVLNRELVIISVGVAMNSVLPHLVGSQLDDLFHLERPIIDFSWETILTHTNNVFELQSVDTIENRYIDDLMNTAVDDESTLGSTQDDSNSIADGFGCRVKKTLVLRGQMLHMEEWGAILFLGTPVMENLDHMFRLGLYINDLSIHDSSRELVLAGTQQSAELKLLLDQEVVKSKRLEDSMKKLDIEMKKTDLLLYQMIPKSVANRLRSGEPSVSTCEVFDICTILFSDVVGFTNICSAISPMQVVNMLNGMYTTFDTLIEKHQLYKVETIGDAYMIVGGVPQQCDEHALYVAEMAFAMLAAMMTLKDPSDRTGKDHLRLRVGIHSGTVVAGVVGLKMPRYCLFGDAVNTASRMESTAEAMKIHISDGARECMLDYPQYTYEERGTVEVKGKGPMKTYFLNEDKEVKANLQKQRSAIIASEAGTQRNLSNKTNSSTHLKSVRVVAPDPPSDRGSQSKKHKSPPPDTSSTKYTGTGSTLSTAVIDAMPSTSQSSAGYYTKNTGGGNSLHSSPTYIHPHHINTAPIATVEPSPAKPLNYISGTQNGQEILNKPPIPGYGEQRRNEAEVVSTADNKMCSTACTIL